MDRWRRKYMIYSIKEEEEEEEEEEGGKCQSLL
jgi:hypothetical protein